MLSKENRNLASTCNSVGQTAGYFAGYVIFLGKFLFLKTAFKSLSSAGISWFCECLFPKRTSWYWIVYSASIPLFLGRVTDLTNSTYRLLRRLFLLSLQLSWSSKKKSRKKRKLTVSWKLTRLIQAFFKRWRITGSSSWKRCSSWTLSNNGWWSSLPVKSPLLLLMESLRWKFSMQAFQKKNWQCWPSRWRQCRSFYRSFWLRWRTDRSLWNCG